MAIDMTPLTSCQYCGKGAGAIFLDSLALSEVRKNHDNGSWQEAIDHDLVIRFNSPRPQAGPCPHLVSIELHICWGAEIDPSDWATMIHWFNPTVREIDPNGDVRNLWRDLAWDVEHEEFLPEQRHQFEKLDDHWPDLDSTIVTERFYETQGIAVYAEDIRAFFTELFEKDEQRRAEWLGGRDTKREWYNVKVVREQVLRTAIHRINSRRVS